MNRIEDERIKFYLEHEAQIQEWAALKVEVSTFADRFYRSIERDLAAALGSGRIDDGDVESSLDDNGNWPGLVLRRRDWPNGRGVPHVRLEWQRKSASFSSDQGTPVVGVKTNLEHYKRPFTKEARPKYPRSSGWWAAYVYVDPPTDGYWKDDNLKAYRDFLVETMFTAWKDLAPLVDEAVGHPRD